MSTKIEWSEEVWNPIVGCSRVSAGCENCYAERVAHRAMQPAHVGLTVMGKKGPRWNGTVRTLPERLSTPLRWRKPRRVFVNSMSDLFHEAVPFEFIAAVFGVMAACPRHTFQLLTKRPARAAEFFAWASSLPTQTGKGWRDGAPVVGYLGEHALRLTGGRCNVWRKGPLAPWPLPNVHIGVSVEDQATADERIPILLTLPAALRWISYEPAIGPVDFWGARYRSPKGGLHGAVSSWGGVNWIVVGGESGPGARPFDLAWARSTVAQCKAAGVPCFVKQVSKRPWHTNSAGQRVQLCMEHNKGGDPSEWPANIQIREMPA